MGTDSGVGFHGENDQELWLMVENGMTPLHAILAAYLMQSAPTFLMFRLISHQAACRLGSRDFHKIWLVQLHTLLRKKLVYLNFAQISDDMIEWPESKEQLLSQYCASSYRAKSAKTLKADLDYAVSIMSLIWAKFR